MILILILNGIITLQFILRIFSAAFLCPRDILPVCRNKQLSSVKTTNITIWYLLVERFLILPYPSPSSIAHTSGKWPTYDRQSINLDKELFADFASLNLGISNLGRRRGWLRASYIASSLYNSSAVTRCLQMSWNGKVEKSAGNLAHLCTSS